MILGIGIGVSLISKTQRTQTQAGSSLVNFMFNPSSLALAQNSPASGSVFIDTKSNQISAVSLEINYDPNFIQVDSVVAESLLTKQIIPPMIEPGKVTLTLGASCQDTCSTFTGTGNLATINFHSLNTSGNTSFSISPNTKVSVVGNPNNMLGTLTNSNITIGSVSPTPLPISDTIPPSVNITSPVNGSTIERRADQLITATAADNVAVQKVDLYVNDTLLCTKTETPYSCTWSLPGKPKAIYNLSAKATDSSGNTTSSEITVSTP
jgi:Cohesin domain.